MNKYKLVGTLNYFDIIPEIILPVFQDEENNFYMAYSDSSDEDLEKYTIKGFTPFKEDDVIRIKFLSNANNEMEEVNEYYEVGDIIIQAMEENENSIYIGRIDKFSTHLENFVNTLKTEEEKNFFNEILGDYKSIVEEMNTKKLGSKNRK